MTQGSVEVRVPDLGDVGTVIVVEWLKAEGERVEEAEDLVEVESEKTAFVVPAPARGRLCARTARAGDRLGVGDLLGRIDED